MKAIVLAAGRGGRMGLQTKDKPKCLVEIWGKSLLQWQMEALRGAGIDNIGIVRGYLAEKFKGAGVRYFENPRWSTTNMVVSLTCAKEWLQRDVCIISYADIIYPADTIVRLKNGIGDIVITYDTEWLKLWKLRFEEPLIDAETFRVDGHGRLLEIGGRTKNVDEIEGQYMGLLKISPNGWKIIEGYLSGFTEEQISKMDVTSILSRLINNGVEIDTVPINGRWFEIDNENDLGLYKAVTEKGNGLW